MDNQISYAPKAREDLLKIKSFIEEEIGDNELAKKTISDIVTTNDSLSAFPEMGIVHSVSLYFLYDVYC